MMANLKVLPFFIFNVLILITIIAEAKPFDCGGCASSCGYRGLGYGGGLGLGGGLGVSCGYSTPITPSISFASVPQPVPIRIPAPRPQSVTIPNIILALLPPNNKPICQPPPIVRPPPVVLPLPQPYPLPIREGSGNYGCYSGCGSGCC